MSRDAIIYCRISRDREGAGLGVDRQREDCEALAESLGWRVVAIYSDNDISAYSGRVRGGYRQLLADLKAGRATAVLAWHSDRLHRNPTELEEYITVCAPNGVVTQTVRAGLLDLATPAGQMNARLVGTVATFESAHKSDRARRKKLQLAQSGQWLGGRRPFGYEDDGVTIRPTEAAEIQNAAEALLSGSSLNAISRDLNARAVPTSTGKPWSSRSLSRVLARPRNAGITEHRGEEIGKAEWEPALDETTWRAVVALLGDPARRTSPGSERRWLGSGIYECGVCEQDGTVSRLIVGTAGMSDKAGRSTTPAYQCRRTASKHVVRSAEHLDRYVTMLAADWLSRPGAVAAFEGGGEDRTARARTIEREALRVRDQEAAEMFADGQMTKAQLIAANEKTAKHRDELDQADAAAARVTALTPFRNGDPAEVWEGLDLDRRRAVISEIMRIIVLPAGKGRPEGWTPEHGKEWGYFDPNAINIIWRVR